MVVYHFAWDLSALLLIETDILAEPAWRWFARSIAGSFLVLVGIGLALAHRDGLRRQAFLRRLARIAAAALAVSAATRIVFPEAWISFGILHCIAASSVLALPFLRAPWPATALAAAGSVAVPRLLTSPAFDHPALDWLGLGAADPVANDYVPVFPWFGAVLIGILAAQAMRSLPSPLRGGAGGGGSAEGPAPATRPSPIGADVACPPQPGPPPPPAPPRKGEGRPIRALAFAGRHSLAIYLLHQPVLFGALSGIVAATGPNPAAEAAVFVRQCSSACLPVRHDEALCRTACACVEDRLKQDGLWRPAVANRLPPQDQPRVRALAQQCFAAPAPARP